MKKISTSPERHRFQREVYVKRQEEKGEPINPDYLEYFQKIIDDHQSKWDDPENRKNNLEYDLLTNEDILKKVRSSDSYAQNLYAAMCNNGFTKLDLIPVLKGEEWSCSWRYAGGIIADMRQMGDYVDWYCSGIGSEDNTFVPEGCVTNEIRSDLKKIGWILSPGGDWENF